MRIYLEQKEEIYMFVYSVRASSIKFFSVVMLSLLVVLGLVFSGNTVFASTDTEGTADFSGIKTKEDRIAFLAAHGVAVDIDSEREESFVMPASFDRVLLEYNEIQKMQGLDLTRYQKKKVTRYTYDVTQTDEAASVATLIVYRGKIIGCDVASRDVGGSVRPVVSL
jgi:hypothetical protein